MLDSQGRFPTNPAGNPALRASNQTSESRVDLRLRDMFDLGRIRILEYARGAIQERSPGFEGLLLTESGGRACLDPFLHLCLTEPRRFPVAQFVFGYADDS